MKQRYIFFYGVIDTFDLYTREFVRIFKENGKDCLVLDAGAMEAEMSRLKEYLRKPVTAVVSFNQVGLYLNFEDKGNIWDYFSVPFYDIIMDHPFHYRTMLLQPPKELVALCMDRNHVDYVRRFYPKVQKVAFLAHAGIRAGENHMPIKDRPIQVLYAGSLSRFAAEGLVPDLGTIQEFDAFTVVQRSLECLIREPWKTTEQVIERILKEMEVELDDQSLGEYISRLRFIDSFAVSFFREQMIRTLVEAGIAVTVFGRGWERCEWADRPGFLYGGEVPPYQILELMEKSKIVLNTMTWFKRGAHDRIFNGMLAHAAVVSDRSEFVEEHFTDKEELRLFGLQETADLPNIVGQLLDDTDYAQAIADRGCESALAGHQWVHRFAELLDWKKVKI